MDYFTSLSAKIKNRKLIYLLIPLQDIRIAVDDELDLLVREAGVEWEGQLTV